MFHKFKTTKKTHRCVEMWICGKEKRGTKESVACIGREKVWYQNSSSVAFFVLISYLTIFLFFL